MVLIYTALQSEAQSIIEYFNLKKINSQPKIYCNDEFLVVIGGVGKDNTIKALETVFKDNNILKAINIGIAGCSNRNISIGEFFCTNKKLEGVSSMCLKTVDNVQTITEEPNLLYDMEAKYFEQVANQYLEKDNIYIFKVVSDHLESNIPSKEFVKQLIRNTINKWKKNI